MSETTAAPAGRTARALVRIMALDVGAPMAVFYLLHALGVGDVSALLASAVPPLLNAAATAARERRVEPIALGVLVATLLSALLAVLGRGGAPGAGGPPGGGGA